MNGINNTWYIGTTECSSAIKMNTVLIYATTWMNLESIRLSKISQAQKDKYHMYPLIKNI